MTRTASYRRGDGLGRVIVVGTALLLVVAGGAAFSRSLGVWDGRAGARAGTRSSARLITPDVSRFVHEHGGLVFPLTALVALVLALLGSALLRAELRLRPARATQVDLTDDARHGVTRVATPLLTQALVDDLASVPGVQNASAGLRGDPARPLVDVRLDVFEDADLGAVLDEVEHQCLRRLRESFDLHPTATTVELRLVQTQGRRLA